jgi:hypothetical protein
VAIACRLLSVSADLYNALVKTCEKIKNQLLPAL